MTGEDADRDGAWAVEGWRREFSLILWVRTFVIVPVFVSDFMSPFISWMLVVATLQLDISLILGLFPFPSLVQSYKRVGEWAAVLRLVPASGPVQWKLDRIPLPTAQPTSR